jgi:hypothetical protein
VPRQEERLNTLLAAFCEHQHEGEQRQNHERAQFKVAAPMEEMIPGPEVLRDRHRADRYGRENQESPANDREDPRRATAGIEVWSSHAEKTIQSSPH